MMNQAKSELRKSARAIRLVWSLPVAKLLFAISAPVLNGLTLHKSGQRADGLRPGKGGFTLIRMQNGFAKDGAPFSENVLEAPDG